MRTETTNASRASGPNADADRVRAALDSAIITGGAHAGRSVADLSRERPVLLVLLRHFGCTFCREAVAEVATHRASMERVGVLPCFVYMPGDADNGDAAQRKAQQFFARYDAADLPRVADPEQRLYRAMGLVRGSLRQLFGPRVWLRGAQAFAKGHGIGALTGDGFQMPGTFVIADGAVVRAHHAEHAGDHPDYAAMAASCPASCSAEHAAGSG